MLYNFQKDAVLAIISKLEKYNGCILADSVGLGKTFTALAVIKYYENRNKSVLVLCPKKLTNNWNTYKDNYVNNPLSDLATEKMKEIKEKYGPYGIFHSQYPSFEKNGFPLAPWWEAGFGAWGEHSTSGHAAGEMLHLGVDLTKVTRGLQNAMPGFEAPDLFNSKLFIMWGMDPVVAWFGPTSYYMHLAHEYGCKTIVIDPRYTQSAEILADQWIPIRPGTDLAMMLAIAQVLFEEDMLDHEFIEKWVDKEGLDEWRTYVMGEGEDGLKKTPEWAAPITAVPADTIREFARLYGTEKPVHLQYFYSCAKRHMGDYSASASMLLQAMTGNIACHGGCESGACLPTPGRVPAPRADWQRDPGDYQVPVLFNCLGREKAEQDSIPALLVKQVQSSVYMEDTLHRLGELGVDHILEVGPGSALAGFVKKTLPGVVCASVETPEQLNAALTAWKEEL